MIAYHFTRDYFAAIVATLLAGDIGARVVMNGRIPFVEVQTIDGGSVLWTNVTGSQVWAWTFVRPDGSVDGKVTESPADLDVPEVAKLIALFDYVAPPTFPRWDPEELTHPFPEA